VLKGLRCKTLDLNSLVILLSDVRDFNRGSDATKREGLAQPYNWWILGEKYTLEKSGTQIEVGSPLKF